jgi:hypothetical protein
MSRPIARRIVTNCGVSARDKLCIGILQRNQCALHVTGQLQLLAGSGQHLLDFGQRPVVTTS